MQGTSAARLAELLGEWRHGGPAQERLAATLRSLVLDGLLPPQTRLPAERDLAAKLRVSRSTVTSAYDRLRAEGYLASRQGAGSWVTLPGGHRTASDAVVRSEGLDLRVAALPAPALLAELAVEAAGWLPRWLDHHGYEPLGLPVLRAAIARRFDERGLPTRPEQILVTSGALHGLDLVVRTLLRPGRRAIVELPTYPAALDALRAAGLRLASVPVGAGGWDLAALTAAAESSGSALAYLIPDFQNPTGMLLDGASRRRALRLLDRAGTVAVIDETFADLALDDVDLPAPAAAESRRAITLGSLGKSVWGGLRIGWIRADPVLIQRLATTRSGSDLAGPVLEQLLAVRVLESFDEIVRDRRALARERRATLLDAIDRRLPTWRYVRPRGGLCVWAELPAPISTGLAVQAREHGLFLTPGPRFGAAGLLERFLRLPFSLAPDRLEAAVSILAALAPQRGAGVVADDRIRYASLTAFVSASSPCEAWSVLATDAKHEDRADVGEAAERAEPAVRIAAVAPGEFDDKSNDDRCDHGDAGDRGCVDVDLAEPFVAAVSAEPANRLAAAAEKEECGCSLLRLSVL